MQASNKLQTIEMYIMYLRHGGNDVPLPQLVVFDVVGRDGGLPTEVHEQDRRPQDLQIAAAVLGQGVLLLPVEEHHMENLYQSGMRDLRLPEKRARKNCTPRLPKARTPSCHSSHHCTALEAPITRFFFWKYYLFLNKFGK